jgi:polyribonucleotide nucleotidyltransferase
MKTSFKKEIQINGKTIELEFGRVAYQANGACLAKMGETLVLATVVASELKEDMGYFPLFVEYQEKLYAGGKIKGSRWVKREGRPSDEAILTARLIDRSIRPLFPKHYKSEVQVVITVLSFDGENDPDVLSIVAVSAALSVSDIPWNGPVGAVRVGVKEDNFFINPVYQELDFSDLDLVLSGTDNEIVMIEAGADEVGEDKMVEALKAGFENIKKITSFIRQIQKEIGIKKQEFVSKKEDTKLENKVSKKITSQLKNLLKENKEGKLSQLSEIKKALQEEMEDEDKKEVEKAFNKVFADLVRDNILTKGKRMDGRSLDKIRPLNMEAGLLPRTHGSAIFQRGLTQALTITTLGSPSLEQLIEGMEGEETKRYIHHYYMPPFSVGETGRMGWPSRREVGHGALAERALLPMIPSEEKFPYTIRVVSEITSSNGSTSMASVCASSLSLMDAGVPLKKPVAGIAMGLIAKTNEVKGKTKIKDSVILTDILGMEDHLGDMDFKVAGTVDGITALQMDVKTLGITPELLAKGLAQAKEARLFILKEMKKVLASPRANISKYAPKIAVVQVDKEKIGEVIGPGGRMIRQIIAETGAAVDIDDDGIVTITASDKESIDKAVNWIEGLTKEVEVGEEFVGEVKRIQPFGAFIEVLPGKEGLVHISKMSAQYVKHPSDVVKVGDEVKVKVVEIDDLGRINLSMFFGEQTRQNKDKGKERQSLQKSSQNRNKQDKRNSSKSFNFEKKL